MSAVVGSRIDTLILTTNRSLQPSALHALTINDIVMQEDDLPPVSDLRGFESVAKYVLAYDHATIVDNDERSKWTAVRYMALRHMMAECDRVKNTVYHQECVRKVLDWFNTSGQDHLEADVATSLAHISPTKPPPSKHASEGNRVDKTKTPPSQPSVSEQLERFKTRDLRTSHIHRIAELRDRGFTVASPRELNIPPEGDNNQMEAIHPTNPAAAAADRRVHAHYQYHTPETDAEHELNQLWLLQRQEDATNKVKHDEVESVLHKWSRGRSREEAEFLRKQESTRMMAHKHHPNLPLHVTLAEDTTNQDEYSLDPAASSTSKSQAKHSVAPTVIKKKPSATGMRYRNPLPPNYRPSPTAISTAATGAAPSPSMHPKSPSFTRTNSAMSLGEPAAFHDKDVKEKDKYLPFTASYTSLVAPDAKQAQLQRMTSKRKVKKTTDVRGTIVPQNDAAAMRDPELKLFYEASMERQCVMQGRGQTGGGGSRGSLAGHPHLVQQTTSRALGHSSSAVDVKRPAAAVAGSSSLRAQQTDELADIRAAFERHNLMYNPAVFERAILIPEDKSAAECVKHLPIAGSKLVENPLLATKLKLMKNLDGGGKKKKAKKGAKKGGKKGKKKKAK